MLIVLIVFNFVVYKYTHISKSYTKILHLFQIVKFFVDFFKKMFIIDIMGYVYLLLVVDEKGNEKYKIGVTKRNITKRISELQTGNESKINLLKQYESENYNKVEKSMHLKYSSYRTEANNEWFSLEAEHVISFLEDCKEADEIISFLLENNPFYK